MRIKKSASLFSVAIIFLCFYGCGTHGSLKGYRYQTTKENLQRAVMAVIENNSTIYRDTSLDHLNSLAPQVQSDSTRDQAAGNNYYNDITNYVTIKIISNENVNEYTFRYYGDENDWKIPIVLKYLFVMLMIKTIKGEVRAMEEYHQKC